jgi:hypothetical protein
MSARTILTVGTDQQYHTIGAAISAANSTGGNVTIRVTAGTYVNDGGVINSNNVTVEGVGGIAKLVGASAMSGGAAAISVNGVNVSLANLDISGVADGAGVLVRSGNVSLSALLVHDNLEGVVDTPYLYADPDNELTIRASEIANNGTNINVGTIHALEVSSSSVHDAQGGDEVKSLASLNFFSAASIVDNTSDAAYGIDLPAGGYLGISDSFIEKGPNSSTKSMISFDSTGASTPGSQVTLADDTLVNDVFPNTDTLLDRPVANLQTYSESLTWNLPKLNADILAGPTTYEALSSRPTLPRLFQPDAGTAPTLSFVTGNRDGGVTIAGKFSYGLTVTVADTVGGKTTILGTAVTGSNGDFALTSHAKIDVTKLNVFTVSGEDPFGRVGSMPTSLVLTDVGVDHVTSDSVMGNVFAVMSFNGSDIIDGFKTTASAGGFHDVLNFSGRGVISFAQVQAMMSGSASTVLTMAGGKTITFEGVSPTTLSATDFAYS